MDQHSNGQRMMINGQVVDFNRNVVERDVSELRFEPKIARLLCLFAENNGSVISRQTIIDEVWSGAFGADQSLTTAVSQLRKILNEAGIGARAIETVPKIGYRFVAEVAPATAPGAPPRERNPSAGGTAAALARTADASERQYAPKPDYRRYAAFALFGAIALSLALAVSSIQPRLKARGPATDDGAQTAPIIWEEDAGSIAVIADVNIANAIYGESLAPATPGNSAFFANLIGRGKRVVIQDTSNTGSVFIVAGAPSIDAYYRAMSGVTSRLLGSDEAVTSATLDGAALFISFLPNDEFETGEIEALSAFLAEGGRVLFLGDSFDYATNNLYINKALVALGSELSIQHYKFDQDFRYASGDQIAVHPLTDGITRFTYATVNIVLGGDPLFRTIHGAPFAAVEAFDPHDYEKVPG
ncbi:MAG: winged helix-turn-helix domain-containing protein [Pseudomonadota bacterium]